MRFHCDRAAEERRRRKRAKLEEVARRATMWRQVFAWKPIKVAHDDCRWLEFVWMHHSWARVKESSDGSIQYVQYDVVHYLPRETPPPIEQQLECYLYPHRFQ